MTAVMRALSSSGPQVVRIARVQAGRVTDERVLKPGDSVVVGPSEHCTFVIDPSVLPKPLRLFDQGNRSATLHPAAGMSGVLLNDGERIDLADVGGPFELRRDARGKIILGTTTLLFQLITPPPVRPRAQLPASMTRMSLGTDWQTTMIAAACFLIHFAAIGGLYSDWLDPIQDDAVVTRGLVESVRDMPTPPTIEDVPETVDKPGKMSRSKAKDRENPNKPSTGAKSRRGRGAAATARDAALMAQMDQLEMVTLGALIGRGSATAGVLNDGDLPTGPLDEAAARSVGVGGPGLHVPGGKPLPPGSEFTIADFGNRRQHAANKPRGTTRQVAPPRGNASVAGPSVGGGTIANAGAVVAGLRPGFRVCYNRGLSASPDAEGSIRLSIYVGSNGDVTGVSGSSSGNLPSTVVSCVKGRARSASFDPPVGGKAVVVVPVTFIKQKR